MSSRMQTRIVQGPVMENAGNHQSHASKPSFQVNKNVKQLFESFFFEAQVILSFDGVEFENNHANRCCTIGIPAKHCVNYRLFANQDYVGELRISRNSRFTDSDFASLENLISTVIEPLRKTMTYQDALESL